MPSKHKQHYTFAINYLKLLPANAGKPTAFAINGPEVYVITDANKHYTFRGERLIERILWPIEAERHLT